MKSRWHHDVMSQTKWFRNKRSAPRLGVKSRQGWLCCPVGTEQRRFRLGGCPKI